jgi:DNA-binding NtrC family response regulator
LGRTYQKKSPDTPVILITGADRGTVLKMVEAGPVDSIIFKPFMLDDLQASVQRALAF